MTTPFLLEEHVAGCVPLRIAELRQQGGPTVEDRAHVRSSAMDIAAHADVLLFYEKDRTRELAAKLVDAIAVLAFCPGGITVFGQHFEAAPPALGEEPGPACRMCGCTDSNCRGCVERTGAPCWWVEANLCSACAAQAVQP